MHVKRISVGRYGPMIPFDASTGAFTLVHGPNERGKTLLIDALIRMLLGKDLRAPHAKWYGNLKRVEERPEGFVILGGEDGEIKLSADGESFLRRAGVDLTAEDFRNLFVIRDSDVTVRDEADYYASVGEKLTGLRTSEITKTITAAQRIGRLRSASVDSKLVNNMEQGKFADAMEEAQVFVTEATGLRERLVSAGFDALVDRLVAIRERREQISAEMERYRSGERRERVVEILETVASCEVAQRKLDEMPVVDAADVETWRSALADRRHVEASLAVEREQLDRLETEPVRATADPVARVLWITAGATALALTGYLVAPSAAIAVAGAVALIGAIASGGALVRRSRLNAMRRDIQRENSETTIRNLMKQLADADATVTSLEVRTGMNAPEELETAIARRSRMEAEVRASHNALRKDVARVDLDADASIASWKTWLEAMRDTESAASGETKNFRDAIRKLEAESRELAAEEKATQEKLERGRRALHAIETRANRIEYVPDIPPCRTTRDLDHVVGVIRTWCEGLEAEQRAAQQTISILQQIEDEERERVGDLFGPGSTVSRVFEEITGGRYREVTFDSETGGIVVQEADGDTVDATALSGGAFDQLYLAVRLAIADAVFGESKGFFIMDDPFIKADTKRLKASLDVLRRFVSRGWQVLYFSAKDEVLQALQPDVDAGRVRLIALEHAVPQPRREPVDEHPVPASATFSREPFSPKPPATRISPRDKPGDSRPGDDDQQQLF